MPPPPGLFLLLAHKTAQEILQHHEDGQAEGGTSLAGHLDPLGVPTTEPHYDISTAGHQETPESHPTQWSLSPVATEP